MSIEVINAVLQNDLIGLHKLLSPVNDSEARSKADVNIQEHITGNTPLHYACRYGNFDMIHLLLFYGANRSIRNNLGILPMEEYELQTSDPIFYYAEEYKENMGIQDNRDIDQHDELNDDYIFYKRKIKNLLNKLKLCFVRRTEQEVLDFLKINK